MIDFPRWYYRIEGFLRNYKNFERFLPKIERNIIKTAEERQEILDCIKILYVFYWKILRDFLKADGVKIFLPREIFAEAKKRGMIEDDEVWFEYIDLLNELCLGTTTERQQEISHQILFIAKKNFPRAKKVLEAKFLKRKAEHKHNYIRGFSYEKPQYAEDEIGISREDYLRLMDYLQKHPEIAYVWLHGSRVDGSARKNSDIDFLVDSPLEGFDVIRNSISKVRIPYRVDCANIYTVENAEFVDRISNHAKLIYRREDFMKPCD